MHGIMSLDSIIARYAPNIAGCDNPDMIAREVATAVVATLESGEYLFGTMKTIVNNVNVTVGVVDRVVRDKQFSVSVLIFPLSENVDSEPPLARCAMFARAIGFSVV